MTYVTGTNGRQFVAKDWESMGVHAEAFEYMLKERGSLNDGSAVSEFINLNMEG